jgi:hypothetical protein
MPGQDRLMGACIAILCWFLPVLLPLQAQAQQQPGPAVAKLAGHHFSSMAIGAVAPPWRLVGLPGQKVPLTQFAITQDGNTPVLRIQADASYGNLLFDMSRSTLPGDAVLRWRWQLARAPEGTDLRRKDGDDSPLKVCALFDMPLQGMSFGEQTRLRMARAMSGEALPAATLCYVWDRLLPVGSQLPNVFSARVRYLVVSQGPAQPGKWLALERNLARDFLRAFGHESALVPPLLALAIGADADNAATHSLGYVGDLDLSEP